MNSRPPNGGIALHEAPTRRRHGARRLRVAQKPHRYRCGGCRRPRKAWPWGRLAVAGSQARNSSPGTPLQRPTREKVRPARQKTPILGHYEHAGRTFSRSHPPPDPAGRTFSRTGHSHVSTVKPPSPQRPLMQTNVKPPSPMLAPEQQPLKPPSPLRPINAPKTAISHPQRRRRFQSHTRTSGQRRWRFHARDLRCPRAMAGPGRSSIRRTEPHISVQAPPVWRAPEGPEGTGGLRGAAPNEVRP